MKKIFIIAFLIVIVVALLNIEVTYRQGINFQVKSIKIPLYLKIIDFFDRHYNYKNLIKKIISDSDNEQQRVTKLFEWTHCNIRRVPKGFPIVDDHVWSIIVRGYGTDDQFQDVFSTLCNYAGIDAFFDFIYTKDQTQIKSLSFVRLNKEWRVFDVYNGVYFKNKNGDFATIEQIRSQDWIVFDVMGLNKQNPDYAKYLENLPLIKEIGLKRANIQSPFKRFLFWIKNRLGIHKN